MRSKRQRHQAISSSSPIGVFDSGVGGLTVLRALLDRLPGEDFVYLGDTASTIALDALTREFDPVPVIGVLAPALHKVLGPAVAIVDSAATTAVALTDALEQRGLLRHDQATGNVTLLATDGPERFARVGAMLLGRSLAQGDIEIVDLALAQAPSGA